MAGTATLTTPSFSESPVWERIVTFVLTSTSGADEIKQTIPINGILQKIIAKSGAAAGITGTFTLAIDDNAGNEIFTAATPVTPAEGATSTFSVSEPVNGTIVVGVNPNDDPTSGTWTITIYLRGIR